MDDRERFDDIPVRRRRQRSDACSRVIEQTVLYLAAYAKHCGYDHCREAEEAGGRHAVKEPRAPASRCGSGARRDHSSSVLLHAAPVLTADFEQRIGDLPQRTNAHRIHELGEHVTTVDDRLPELRKSGRRLTRILRMKIAEAFQLRLLFLVGRASQFDRMRRRVAVWIAERVDADNRIAAVMLLVLVVEGLFLNLAA